MDKTVDNVEQKLKAQFPQYTEDTASDEPVAMITRSSARGQREAERRGVVVKLPATNGSARIRIISAEEVIAGSWLPNRLQKIMGEMLVGVGGGSTTLKASDGRDAFLKLRKLAQDELDLADVIVQHAFIEPEVVDKESDLDPDRDDQILVTDLHENDRRAILRMVVGNQSQGDVKIIENFRAEPGGAVPGQ